MVDYTPQTWVDNDPTTPLSAARMTHIESGVDAAALQATAALARANHTGTQASTTISDFTEAVQDAVAVLLGAGSNVTLNYDDVGNVLTINAVGDGTGTTDPEVVRDTIGIAMVGAGVVSVAVNDAADTITISSTATANSTDAALRDRGTHTGTQAAATISDLTETVQDTVAGALVAGANVTLTYDDVTGKITVAAASGGGSTPSVHMARQWKQNDQAIATTFAAVNITLGSAGEDVGANVAQATDGLQAMVAGVYLISATVWQTGGSTGERNFSMRVNGATVREFGAVDPGRVGLSDAVILAANDVVTLTGYFAVGSVTVKGGHFKDTGITLTYLGPAAT